MITTVGAGQATISGTVTTSAGVFPVSATIDVLAPVMTALSADSGPYATTITITGSGFVAAGFTTNVTVGGATLGNFTVDSDTQITAEMPSYNLGTTKTVLVDVGGVLSNGLTWTQVGPFNEFATENNDPGTAGGVVPVASLPAELGGNLLLSEPANPSFGNQLDWVEFTVSSDVTIQVIVDFDGSDVDVFVNNQGSTGFDGVCGFAGATGAHPEDFTCPLTAGTYWIGMNNYDGEENAWTLLLTIP